MNLEGILTFNVRIVAPSEEIRFTNVSEDTANLLEKLCKLAGFEACFSADIKKPLSYESGQLDAILHSPDAKITERYDNPKCKTAMSCLSGEDSPKGCIADIHIGCDFPNCICTPNLTAKEMRDSGIILSKEGGRS